MTLREEIYDTISGALNFEGQVDQILDAVEKRLEVLNDEEIVPIENKIIEKYWADSPKVILGECITEGSQATVDKIKRRLRE